MSLRTTRALRGCTIAALGLASLTTGRAQTLRTETQVVLVDVVASDKKGYVRNLGIGDFRVFEDGKEQKLTSVTREAGTAAVPASRRHYVVLLFDNASMTVAEQQLSRQTASRFLDSMIAGAGNPQSVAAVPLTAVVSFIQELRVGQTFTEDSQRVKQAIANQPVNASVVGTSGNSADNQITNFAAANEIQALETLMQNLERVPGRVSLVWFTPGFPMSGDAVVYVDRAISAANRSNIAIYPVLMRSVTLTSTPGGTSDQPTTAGNARAIRSVPYTLNSAAMASSSDTISGISRLASKTGGFLIGQPADQVGLAKAGAESGEYYLLGYTPPPSAPGTCHKLRVEVKRKNVDLRSRVEYCNRNTADVISGSPVQRTLEARVQEPGSGTATTAAAGSNTVIAATEQTSFFYTGAGVARVVVAMEINPANIHFTKDKNTFQASIDILGLAQKADGSTSARFSDTKKFEFATQAQVDAFKNQPYRHEAQFDIAPGDYTLAVAFGSGVPASDTRAGGSFGRVSTPLHIDAYQTTDFMISGLALGEKLRDSNQGDSGLDELLIDDRKKLVTQGTELIAAGSRRFKATVPGIVFLEIYEPLWASAATRASTVIAMQMRILDRAAGTPKVDSGLVRLDPASTPPSIKNGTAVIPLGLSLPFANLGSGSYRLEIQLVDTAGKNAKRTADFEIE